MEAKMITEITFQKTSDPFISAGISGLIKYCKKRKESIGDINYSVQGNDLTIISDNLNTALMEMYFEMGSEYYDTSVKKSLDDATAFFYDEKLREVIQSKYKTFGMAYLINNSKQRNIGSSVLLKDCPDEVKAIVTQYLEKNGVKEIDNDTYEIFLGGRYTTVPQMEDIQVSSGDKVCSICGHSYRKVYESKSFSPFLGGASAGNNYVSQLKGTEKVCWKCLYLQRFSPVRAFYKMSGDLNVFIFNSDTIENLETINSNLLKSMYYTKEQLIEANYIRNYDDYKFEKDEIKDYFNHFHEQMLMIMYTLFKKMEFVRPHFVDPNDWLDFEEMVNYRSEVFYFRAKKYGSTYRPVYADKFTDIHYLFTVFNLMEGKQINLQHLLWDLKLAKGDSSDDPTIFRNQLVEAILNHKPTIGICERIVGKNFVNPTFHRNFFGILNWLRMYETIIQYGGNKTMDDETRELAIKLGSQLGFAAKSDENPKAGKGRLIAMRKSRKLSQFLDHLIVFQGRYNVCVNKEILQKINEENFEYFRQFAIISAFNSFNYNPQKEGEKK
jgi:hypothetical protein